MSIFKPYSFGYLGQNLKNWLTHLDMHIFWYNYRKKKSDYSNLRWGWGFLGTLEKNGKNEKIITKIGQIVKNRLKSTKNQQMSICGWKLVKKFN